MSDHDRRLADIEKRLTRLERMLEKPTVDVGVPGMMRDINGNQFCPCGRDVCRAPDCPSHKPERANAPSS